MAVEPGMFLFEVVVGNVKSLVESRQLIIRSEFGEIFSLELKDPKQMNIVIPEPPPLPPVPPGKKKGKKKAAPKKGKKGKKGAVEAPPPEPVIQSGQSILFPSTAEYLIQSMKKFPLEVSLWNKEDYLVYIGSATINWDPVYLSYLEKICNCEDPPPVTVADEYNVFEEEAAKLMAKIQIQIKLSYLKDKLTTAFRCLSEDLNVKKYLYTGINSKTTSYMCTLKTSDDVYIENADKVKEDTYVVDKPKPTKINYADYSNAPGANLTFFNEGDYCCMSNADKPPDSIYKSPETLPDIDFIVDYVRKIIVSCNDNMRMLTPRPTIRPFIKATDIDRMCYCKETDWPRGKLAERFQREAQSGPCGLCKDAGKDPEGSRGVVFDVANLRGPCGRPDCRIARHLRAYIENLAEEDAAEININEIIGPCGSKECTLAEKIQEFLRHEGVFSEASTLEGLSTQCACTKKLKEALLTKKACMPVCIEDCENNPGTSTCDGNKCPFKKKEPVYTVNYFTVEYDFAKSKSDSPVSSKKSSRTSLSTGSNLNFRPCPSSKFLEKSTCSKMTCRAGMSDSQLAELAKKQPQTCMDPVCPSSKELSVKNGNDSDVEIHFDDIHNKCCVKTCDVAEKVKDFIVDGIMSNKDKIGIHDSDVCLCDCVCTFKFSKNTTYCGVCGGFESLGDDMKNQPIYAQPHPCPVYHKLYDKKYLQVPEVWPDSQPHKQDTISVKSNKQSKHGTTKDTMSSDGRSASANPRKSSKKPDDKPEKKNKTRKSAKLTALDFKEPEIKYHACINASDRPEAKYPYPIVPRHMGWNWIAEDIPGMKPRPKWKPGAANRILVRRYRMLREGLDIIAKKKRAMMNRKKKIEMKPTLIIKKKDGEYTVQMEVFKKYSKERLLFQYPYDEKPPVIYTVGRTEEENRKIQKKRDRRERRETRRKSKLIQSTFRDKCQEICVKAYNQAIGILPLPNPNCPDCPCQTTDPNLSVPPIDSCSCSEEGSVSSSDTDGDEWTIEFTAPAARWDGKAKHPPIMTDNESQYTYLDYKVTIKDKQGNQLPRFFKGPDGKQECTDLGGFWGPNHVWMEINKDGYLGPDNRWVPMNFTGPDGMYYSAEEGFFSDANGKTYKIGVDGYIDKDYKWVFYPGRRGGCSKTTVNTKTGRTPIKQEPAKPVPAVKDKASPPATPKPGKAPHGIMTNTNNNHKKPSHTKGKNTVVMSLAVESDRPRFGGLRHVDSVRLPYVENMRLDPEKVAKYREIMNELEMYDSLALSELKSPVKADRASNTSKKYVSPYTIQQRGSRYGNLNSVPLRNKTNPLPKYGPYNRSYSPSQYMNPPMETFTEKSYSTGTNLTVKNEA